METPMGYHLIRVDERRVQDFDDVAPSYRRRVQARMVAEAEGAYVEALEQHAQPEPQRRYRRAPGHRVGLVARPHLGDLEIGVGEVVPEEALGLLERLGVVETLERIRRALHDLPELAFDHEKILAVAHERLRGKVRYQPIGFELLPAKFTLSQLQKLYETILEKAIDKRNFRKKILGMDLLVELDEVQQDVAHRAARLYRFDRRKYQRLVKKGFHFEI